MLKMYFVPVALFSFFVILSFGCRCAALWNTEQAAGLGIKKETVFRLTQEMS